MATRALIGYLDTDGDAKLTTTYNHYDGYPSNLGKGLNDFYSSDAKAEEIANVGYISFLDGETGEWDAKNKSAADVVQLPDNFNEAMMTIAEEIDKMGVDYGYIWDNENEEWVTVKNNGIGRMAEDLEMNLAHLKGKFDMMPERPEQTMEEGNLGHNEIASLEPEGRFWIVSWRGMDGPKEKVFTDEDEAREFMDNLNKPTPEIPGFEGTRAALDDLFEAEYIKHQWQHRAGIIK